MNIKIFKCIVVTYSFISDKTQLWRSFDNASSERLAFQFACVKLFQSTVALSCSCWNVLTIKEESMASTITSRLNICGRILKIGRMIYFILCTS